MKNNFLKSILLKMHKNGDIFSVDVYSELGLQGSFILQYYVIGNTNSFNGSYPLYPAYRPYRYDFNLPFENAKRKDCNKLIVLIDTISIHLKIGHLQNTITYLQTSIALVHRCQKTLCKAAMERKPRKNQK